MILTRDEAICLVLKFSKNKTINSLMKLNKLVARLNLYFIPLAIDFSLNKWGSFDANLRDLETNEHFDKSFYLYQNKQIPLFKLKEEGEKLVEQIFNNKIKKIMNQEEINELKEDIFERSQLPARELSEEEHEELLVNKEDRTELIQRINTVAVEMFDLYQEVNKISEDTIEGISLAAFIEYCYHLSKYLKEKRFKNIEFEGYDFDAYMFDYYFLYLLENVIPIIKEQITKKEKNKILINKYYQYFVNSVKDRYPFSLENPNLFKIIAQ